MRKKWVIVLFSFFILSPLIGCVNKEDNVNGKAIANSNKTNETTSDSNEDITLPKEFPADFPLPEDIEITSVEDDSDEDRYSFEIRFNFNPNIDMDATFEIYKDYAEELEYNIIMGGEEYFADGIFQFGATSKFSTSDMFIVTLKPDGTTFGDIQLKVSKQ